MEDINLHFTGDFHAIGAANNLLAAMIDNHIFQGNALNIDPRKITWKRCVDMNDRQLRSVVDGLGGRTNGMPREQFWTLTAQQKPGRHTTRKCQHGRNRKTSQKEQKLSASLKLRWEIEFSIFQHSLQPVCQP